MNAKRPQTIPPLGRAIFGAISGILLMPVIAALLGYGRIGEPMTPDETFRFFVVTASVGSGLGAAFGVAVGAREIRGKTGATVQGLVWGAVAGVPVGAALGWMSVNPKMFMPVGIFMGGPLGSVVGGIIGANSYGASDEKKPSTLSEGVGDRELDGP